VLDALDLGRRTGTPCLEESRLLALVIALTMAGRTTEAVELHGAVQDSLPALRKRLPARTLAIYETAVDRARESLGPRAFGRRIAGGSLHTWSSTLSLAEKRGTELAGHTIPTTANSSIAVRSGSVPGDNAQSLSRREIEVLRLIASGCSNKDVASSLNLRPKTVTHHASSLFRKLEVKGRA
jgi:ATP/maltotriose-dependent transcriptional regulator MalT